MNRGFIWGTAIVVLLLLFSSKSKASITVAQMQDVKVRICEAAGRQGQCKIILVRDDTPNAMAIYEEISVNDGLLFYVDTVDEFAGVYAHELCHIIHNDSYRDLPTIVGERQADECARPLAIRAGYSPILMAEFYVKINRDDGPGGGNTHPDNPSRIKFYRTGSWK